LREIWKARGAAQRLSVLAATSVLIVGLGALAFGLLARAEYGPALCRLSDANPRKSSRLWTIQSSLTKWGRWRQFDHGSLRQVHLNRMQWRPRHSPRRGFGFEISKTQFWHFRLRQRANYVRRLQGELSQRTISARLMKCLRARDRAAGKPAAAHKDKYPTRPFFFVRVLGNSHFTSIHQFDFRFLSQISVEWLKPSRTVVYNLGMCLSETRQRFAGPDVQHPTSPAAESGQYPRQKGAVTNLKRARALARHSFASQPNHFDRLRALKKNSIRMARWFRSHTKMRQNTVRRLLTTSSPSEFG